MDEREQALERIYRERYLGFRNALATITGDYESARDVVQEAFARALKNRKSFRGEGSLEGWVWRIAIRTALEHRGEHPSATLHDERGKSLRKQQLRWPWTPPRTDR